MEQTQVEPQAEPEKKKKPKLRDTQELFVSEYLQSWNATEAYLASHPSCKSRGVAYTSGSRMLRNVQIRALVDQRLKEKAMGADEILARLADQARGSHYPFIQIGDEGQIFFNFKNPEAKKHLYLIKKIKTKRTRRVEGRGKTAIPWEDEWIEVELHDPQKALEMLGKHALLFLDKPQAAGSTEHYFLDIPADKMARSFVDAYRDIKAGKHTEYLFFGGRGSTKSSFISMVIVWLIRNNPDFNAVIMRQVGETLRTSVYAQVKWAIEELGYSSDFKCITSPMEIEYIPTGQRIYFRGADDPGKIKSIKTEKGYIALLWLEELDQFKGGEAVRKIEQSVVRGGDRAFIFKSFNPPPTASNWANKYVLIPKATQYQHKSNYLDVPPEWLGVPWLAEAEHLKQVNPKAYAHEYMGEVTGAGGMVFENLEIRAITDEEIAKFDHIHQGVDWGYYPHPYAWVKMNNDADREILYIFDEYRVLKASNEKTAKYLKDEKHVTPEDELIADSAEPKSVADYRIYGLSCRGADKGPGSVERGFEWLQNRVKIVIDPVRAPETAQEFMDYEYERDKNDEIISGYPEVNDHSIAASRYGTERIWRRRGE